MNPQRIGFLVSGMFHLGLLWLIYCSLTFASPKSTANEELFISLQMFSDGNNVEHEQIFEQESSTLQDSVEEQLPGLAEAAAKNNHIMPETVLLKKTPMVRDVLNRPPEQDHNHPEHIAEAEVVVPDIDITYIRLLEEQYTHTLKKAIEARKYYPVQARRRARQGDVVVAFRVNRVGNINNIRIVRSSSSRSLDRAAINAVNSVGKFQDFPVEIKREWWDFEIALTYSLL